MIKLVLASLAARKFSTFLCVLALGLGTALALSVERLQESVREGFTGAIQDADLIVGARTGDLQLLLYSVFHIGAPTQNIRYATYEKYAQHPQVQWAIPLALGDSYRGHRVVGTNENFFQHYRYRDNRALAFAAGGPFQKLFEVVLGSQVARAHGHQLGDTLRLSHGVSRGGREHDRVVFRVVGILEKTATPVDKAVYTSLEGIEAIHIGWGRPGQEAAAAKLTDLDRQSISPEQLTAMFLNVSSPIFLLRLQNQIRRDRFEPLSAVIPGMALQRLWSMLSYAEAALQAMAWAVVISGFLTVLVAISLALHLRQREMVILRLVGVPPFYLLGLYWLESFFLTALGLLFGLAAYQVGLGALAPFLEQHFSVFLPPLSLGISELKVGLIVFALGSLAGLLPAFQALAKSLKVKSL